MRYLHDRPATYVEVAQTGTERSHKPYSYHRIAVTSGNDYL